MKYIDAGKLKAEIERRIEACRQKIAEFEKNGDEISAHIEGLEVAPLISLIPFIDYLQQEQTEVDLKKEIANLEFMGNNDARDVQMIARKFYELGLKAGK